MPKFNLKFRGFYSLLLFFSFIISLISGIVLYFPPQGKIAHWMHWTFWGLDKEMWGALHINSSLIFFIIAILHLYYNWKVLFRYIKKKAVMDFNLKAELFTATVVSIFIILATIYNIEPFRTIIKWNDNIKNYWAEQIQAQPPTPHAEDFTVAEFCEQLDISIQNFQQQFNQQGWKFDNSEDKIKDIAKQNRVSPAEIYNLLKTPGKNRQGQESGGRGRKTVQQVCEEMNKNATDVLKSLTTYGITVSKDDQLKIIASKHNMRPIDIINLINQN